jgi:hypothetical protein
MVSNVYRYVFTEHIPFGEVEDTLQLALITLESLHGEVRVRLDARYAVEESKRACVIDASTEVGQQLNEIFLGYLRREFDDDAFEVKRVESEPMAMAG